jgi:solute carrier family 35 (UDP-sugar transporter), member A1/2/3
MTSSGTASTPVTGSAIALNNDNQSQVQANMASFKLMLLVMMVLQNSSTVLVGRYTRAGVPESQLYDVNHLILVIELGKLLLSAALEFYTTQGKLIQSIHTHNFQRPADALKILVPALLYLVQNTLLYVALSNLTAPIFQVTYQAKLVTTALVSVFLLQRSYSVQQWICLFVLSIGVAIVVLGEKKASSGARRLAEAAAAQNLVLGLTAVSIACFSSALAGVYFEMVLKKPPTDATKQAPASLWMRNIQLSFFSVVIAAVQGFFQKKPAVPVPYLHGFSIWAWVLVLLQAGGGLLVAAVIKYADNVLKGLATGVSVVFATVLSMAFFGTPLTGQFSVGAGMILGAVYFFSNPLPAAITGADGSSKKTEDDTVEMKNLLPK